MNPWRSAGEVSDDDALGLVRGIRAAMQRSVERGGRIESPWVFERTWLPCRRCGTLIRARGQGDDNRTTYWCPACQST